MLLFSLMIIYLFAAARSASQRLRGEVDNLITQVSFYQSGARQRTNITVVIIQCANEMWSHWNNTNMSFQQRITESNDAHNKLQSHLSKTMQEIYDQEKHIEALKKAIRDKGPPLKVLLKTSELSSYFFAGTQVSQTRLEARTHRPDVELCRDPPHHRLVEEVHLNTYLSLKMVGMGWCQFFFIPLCRWASFRRALICLTGN